MPRAKQQQPPCGPMEARVSTRVPQEFKEALQTIASKLGVSVSDVVRGCLAKADPREVEQWCQLGVEWKPPKKRAAPASIEAQQLLLVPPQVAKQEAKTAKKAQQSDRALMRAQNIARQLRSIAKAARRNPNRGPLGAVVAKLERGDRTLTDTEAQTLFMLADSVAAKGTGRGRVSDRSGRTWSNMVGDLFYQATLKRTDNGKELVLVIKDGQNNVISGPDVDDWDRNTLERWVLPQIVAEHWLRTHFPDVGDTPLKSGRL